MRNRKRKNPTNNSNSQEGGESKMENDKNKKPFEPREKLTLLDKNERSPFVALYTPNAIGKHVGDYIDEYIPTPNGYAEALTGAFAFKDSGTSGQFMRMMREPWDFEDFDDAARSFEGYLQREFHILWDWTRNLDAIKRAVRDWQRGIEINKE
jgi:hypothetical protein